MLIDSHCHINFPELSAQLPEVLSRMKEQNVAYALAVSVSRETADEVSALAEQHPHIFASVGVHPAEKDAEDMSLQELTTRAKSPRVVAVGETGLDFHWCRGDLSWQYQRFETHIAAARASGLPLIIHTRDAPAETLRLLRENNAENGVIHCFSEDVTFAEAALDLGFYLSFSGLLTFKNAPDVRAACAYAPADRILVETDSPYLAPVPRRGKLNEPSYVRHTAEFAARLRATPIEEFEEQTTANFFRLFAKAKAS